MLFQIFKSLSLDRYHEFMFSLGHHLGRPLSYETRGAYVCDMKNFVQNGILRTELAFHGIRPSYVLFFCMNIHPYSKFTFTFSKDILSRLDPPVQKTLSSPLFRIHPPVCHAGGYPVSSFWKPVLNGNSLTFGEDHFTEFRNEDARRAYIEMVSIARQERQCIGIEKGDLIVMDNQKMIHGWLSLHVSSEIWLKRLYVL